MTAPATRRLPDLVRNSARRFPDAPAVTGPDGEFSYQELDRLSDRVGGALGSRGVRRADRVAVWLDKSVAMVATTQGILRLGAAYVPIDPLAPVARAAAVIADCAPRLLVTTTARAAALRRHGLGLDMTDELSSSTAGCLADWAESSGSGPDPLPDPGSRPDQLAYILYTSGSTGTPKGVCLSHINALAFVDWAARELGVTHADRFANHAPPQFDLSVLDIYGAFLVGGSVHLIPPEHSYLPDRLVSFLHEKAISIWYSVPSALMLMTRYGGLAETPPDNLRAVLFAGEPYPVRQLLPLRNSWPDVRFLNLYGPTETNVCTYYEVPPLPDDVSEPLPIGYPCPGNEVWVQRDDGERAGVGEEGELVVAGPTVMLGYWGGGAQHGGAYRTGDRAALGSDGAFRYKGRRDGMAKIRGHRVELGEIDEVLHAHPAVVEAATVIVGEGLDARLVAWLVLADGEAPDVLEMKRHCAASLPRYMIVDAVRTVEKLPRTDNGKVDRRRLVELAAGHR